MGGRAGEILAVQFEFVHVFLTANLGVEFRLPLSRNGDSGRRFFFPFGDNVSGPELARLAGQFHFVAGDFASVFDAVILVLHFRLLDE